MPDNLKCYKCGYIWTYTGDKKEDHDYLSCPRCRTNLKLGKAREHTKGDKNK
jgi:hypothetical protein